MNKMFYIAVLLFSVFISAVSQVLLKKAAGKKYANRILEYLNPLVIIAYGIFFLSTLLTIFSYRAVPLSLGAVLETTSYFYVTIFGVTIFKEKITRRKLLALAFIIGGILVYALLG